MPQFVASVASTGDFTGEAHVQTRTSTSALSLFRTHEHKHRHDNCVERTNQRASWMQWVDTECRSADKTGGDEKVTVRKVYREVKGTRKELVDRVFELARPYIFHSWIDTITRHMALLRTNTFDGSTRIQVKADFAATVQLKSEYTGTCEYGNTTNLYVALVLHSPDTGPVKLGLQREVQCDIWRYFTNDKPSAMVHQEVMHDIIKHYKKKVIPNLQWVDLESDGSTTQFKGRKNFYMTAGVTHILFHICILHTHIIFRHRRKFH